MPAKLFLEISSCLRGFLSVVECKASENVCEILLLLLFASTKFCELGIPSILRVLSFAFLRSRAKFCDFAQPKGKAQFWNPLA